jgi:hypothetical protein
MHSQKIAFIPTGDGNKLKMVVVHEENQPSESSETYNINAENVYIKNDVVSDNHAVSDNHVVSDNVVSRNNVVLVNDDVYYNAHVIEAAVLATFTYYLLWNGTSYVRYACLPYYSHYPRYYYSYSDFRRGYWNYRPHYSPHYPVYYRSYYRPSLHRISYYRSSPSHGHSNFRGGGSFGRHGHSNFGSRR